MSNLDVKEATVPQREKEVLGELNILERAISALDATVEELGPALSDVMREGTSNVDEDKAIKELCPMASRVREIRWKVQNIDRYVSDKISRLEI